MADERSLSGWADIIARSAEQARQSGVFHLAEPTVQDRMKPTVNDLRAAAVRARTRTEYPSRGEWDAWRQAVADLLECAADELEVSTDSFGEMMLRILRVAKAISD